MSTILNNAPNFAPKYLVRRIQQPEEPAPSPTFSQNVNISEIADVQCYLKAYFYQIYDARVDEKARKQQEKREKIIATGTPTVQVPEGGKPKPKRSRRAKHIDIRSPSPEFYKPPSSAAEPIIPPLPTPVPPRPETPLLRSSTSKRSHPTSSPPTDTTSTSSFPDGTVLQQQPNISSPSVLQIPNDTFREVLNVVNSGLALLHELLNVETEDSEQQSPSGDLTQDSGDRLIHGLSLLDARTADRFENAIRLRRGVEDPTDPRLVEYDTAVQAALTQVLEQL
ncbi:hypothetical protein FRC00_001111 [Tulasnella sp. 408]|nr:hypothetical protein FRC00_001111 [Tulasnella sp. 408]